MHWYVLVSSFIQNVDSFDKDYKVADNTASEYKKVLSQEKIKHSHCWNEMTINRLILIDSWLPINVPGGSVCIEERFIQRGTWTAYDCCDLSRLTLFRSTIDIYRPQSFRQMSWVSSMQNMWYWCSLCSRQGLLQGLSVPIACVGSGDPVRVLRLYTTNTLDIFWSIYCWGICTTCHYQFNCVMLKPYALRLPTATAVHRSVANH